MIKAIAVFIGAYLVTIVVMPFAGIRGMVRMYRGDIDREKYLKNNAYAHDKLWSAALGYDHKRFLSSVMGEKKERGHKLSCFVCRCLDMLFSQEDHCGESLANERKKNKEG